MSVDRFAAIQARVQPHNHLRSCGFQPGTIESDALELLCEVRRLQSVLAEIHAATMRLPGPDAEARATEVLREIELLCEARRPFAGSGTL